MNGAHDFLMSNSTFVDQSTHITTIVGGRGLGQLLARSTPDAFHDSSARYPPPLCHPGTREDHINQIIQWSTTENYPASQVLWLKGPAGVGKSAIAQTCAERLGKKLGAAFFFSRSNSRDDSTRLFTSVAYQVAMRCKPYGDFLDKLVHRNPTLVEKSMPSQFQELLVAPIEVLQQEVKDLTQCVIIIDGLDECDGMQAQENIIDIITRSVREKTTPLLWIICSRLEPHIVATFSKPDIKPHIFEIELTISRDLDCQILLYLTDKLTDIGSRYGVRQPWPSEMSVWKLVELSSGLFAYAHTVVRFIDDENTKDPLDQLSAVFSLRNHEVLGDRLHHPLATLDVLYTFVLTRIPPKSLINALQIILINRLLPHVAEHEGIEEKMSLTPRSVPIPVTKEYLELLDMSEDQFNHSLQSLHAVMVTGEDSNTRFCHASFMDFLEDRTRSKDFCIWSETATALCNKLLDKFNEVYLVKGPFHGMYPRLGPSEDTLHPMSPYYQLSRALASLLDFAQLEGCQTRLKEFDFRKLCLAPLGYLHVRRMDQFLEKARGLNLIRPYRSRNACSFFLAAFARRPRCRSYVIGHGEGKAILTISYNHELGSRGIEIQPWSEGSLARFKAEIYREI